MTLFASIWAGVVGGVLLKHAAQKIAAAADREADRKREPVAERAMVCGQ
jgi:hypothetical protein